MGLMKVGLLLFLMAFISTTVEARFDANTFLAQMMADNGEPNYFVKSTTTACCDKCFCTRSMPPQCHCNDIGETCHSACEACLCTRSFPPQCRCLDITNFCYPPCSAAANSEPAN